MKESKFSDLPLHVKLFAFSFIGMALTLCAQLYDVWNTRPDYSFGFLVPVFAFYVIYDRRRDIFKFFETPESDEIALGKKTFADYFFNAFFSAMFGFGVLGYICFAILLFMLGTKGYPLFAMTWCFSFLMFASAYFCAPRQHWKERLSFANLFIFSCFIWLIGAPLAGALEEQVSLFLLGAVADIVYNFMSTLGFSVVLRGNVLEFPTGTVGVAEACSGIRSLTACLFAGSFLAATMLDKAWKKVVLVLLSMFFAFLTNIVRALFLSLWAYENGSDSISGTVHDVAGYMVLGATVLCLLVFVMLFQLNPVPKEFRNKDAGKNDSPENNS